MVSEVGFHYFRISWEGGCLGNLPGISVSVSLEGR